METEIKELIDFGLKCIFFYAITMLFIFFLIAFISIIIIINK